MADVGLDGADEKRIAAALCEGLADRRRFYRIADARSRAMRFDEGQSPRVNPLFGIEGIEKPGLVDLRWQRDAVRPPIRIDVAAGNKAKNTIAVTLGGLPRA